MSYRKSGLSQVRGIEQKKGLLPELNPSRYLLPILATAVRRERAALAMEGRSFGALPKRSYYKEVKVQKLDLIAIITVIAYCTVLIFILHSLGILHLSLGLDLN